MTVRRAAARAVVPALAVLLVTGCGLDFTDPFPGDPLRLSAHIDFHRLADDEVRVTATLVPGRTADGRARVVDHDTVEALGTRLGPDELRANGTRSYARSWTPALGGGGNGGEVPLLLRPPRPSSVAEPPAELPFGPCRQAGSPSLTAAPADTLELAVSCDHSPQKPTQSIWRLEARRPDTGGLILTLESSNPAPPVIRIPARWVREEGDPELEITVRLTDLYGWSSPTGDYRIALDTSWSFRWRVTWEEGDDTRQPARAASERIPTKSMMTTSTTKR